MNLPSKIGEPLTCAKCDQSFASKRNLATHMVSVHSEDKNFGCPQCKYKAKSQLLITKHVRRLHKKERKHTCNICAKSFFEKWNLTDHIVAVHQKKKPYGQFFLWNWLKNKTSFSSINILEFQFSICKSNFISEITKTVSQSLELFPYTHKMLHCNGNKWN